MDSYIKQGDCLELLQEIPKGLVKLVLADPPYGMTQCKWDSCIPLQEMWIKIHNIIDDSTPICLFGSEPFSSRLRLSNIDEFKYDWIWDKVKVTGFLNAKRQPMRCHEIISVFYKKQCIYNPQKTAGHPRKVSSAVHKRNSRKTEDYGAHNLTSYDSTERYPRSIQVFSSDVQKSALHPTQKPVALLEYLIKTYTNPGDFVLDFCMGSGSTCIAAINTNRRYIGFELDQQYFNIAKDRINKTIKGDTSINNENSLL